MDTVQAQSLSLERESTMMNRTAGLLFVCSLLALVAGCGFGDGIDGWNAAAGESDSAYGGNGQSTQALSHEGGEGSASFDGDISFTHDCSEGGTITIDGEQSVDIGSDGSAAVSLTHTWNYDECGSDGVVTDGTVEFDSTLSVTTTGTSQEDSYTGSLDFTGDVEESCDIDFSASITTSSDSVEVEGYNGDICGEDPSDVDAAVVASAGADVEI